jgi:TonB family protein
MRHGKHLNWKGGEKMPSLFNLAAHAKSPDERSLQASGSSSPIRCTPKRTFWQSTKPNPVRGAAPENVEFFRTLDDLGCPGRALWASAGGHVAILLVLLAMPLVFTDTLKVKYNAVLIAPSAVERQPPDVTNRRTRKPTIRYISPEVVAISNPLRIPEEPHVSDVSKPAELRLPKIERIETAEVAIPIPRSPVLPPETAPAAPPKIVIRTDSFSNGTATDATAKLHLRDVQTSGFGDSNGAGKNRTNNGGNIASLGSFDRPASPGNGTGGARSVRAIAASSGFGDVKPALSVPKKADAEIPDTPVEITFKPKPDYTGDARKLSLEGEVLLRVLFGATGEVRVLELVRGLGHGLDESAVRAAQQIRFKPALTGGHPVDSTVTVHILFQLAF